MPDPITGTLIGTSIIGGGIASRGARQAVQAQERAGQAGIAAQERAQTRFEERTQPFADIGLQAGQQLQNFLAGDQGAAEINPIVDFLRQEGFEQIQESAAARGRLGAGGTLKDLTRFSENLASTVAPQLQQQRFNQLFNVAGLGANVAAGQGTAGLQTASNVTNLLGNIGGARAGGAQQQANILGGTLGNVLGIEGARRSGAFNFLNTPPPATRRRPDIGFQGNPNALGRVA